MESNNFGSNGVASNNVNASRFAISDIWNCKFFITDLEERKKCSRNLMVFNIPADADTEDGKRKNCKLIKTLYHHTVLDNCSV